MTLKNPLGFSCGYSGSQNRSAIILGKHLDDSICELVLFQKGDFSERLPQNTGFFNSLIPFTPPYDQASYGYGWFVGERLGHRVAGHGGTYSGFRTLIEQLPR